MNNGLIPGGTSLKRDRQAVFFTIVNPMDNQDGFGETLCDLSQARVAPYKNTWKRFQKTIFLVQFEARSTERTAILSNKVKLSFYSTTHCLQSSSRKRYASRPRISFVRKKAGF